MRIKCGTIFVRPTGDSEARPEANRVACPSERVARPESAKGVAGAIETLLAVHHAHRYRAIAMGVPPVALGLIPIILGVPHAKTYLRK